MVVLGAAAVLLIAGRALAGAYADYLWYESLGAVATGPVEALDSAWRIAVQRYRTDGFRTDSYLHRDDTNDRDELTARSRRVRRQELRVRLTLALRTARYIQAFASRGSIVCVIRLTNAS